jgi:hypothetical protein
MGFNLGNAMKYIWRADLKNDAIEDLKKAIWYAQREIEKREREAKEASEAKWTAGLWKSGEMKAEDIAGGSVTNVTMHLHPSNGLPEEIVQKAAAKALYWNARGDL